MVPKCIWWKLFNASCCSKWSNILGLVELLFCIPVTNGHVERVFSTLKHIKTNLQSSLSEDHLDDLLKISVDGPPLGNGMLVMLFGYGGRTSSEDMSVIPEPHQQILMSVVKRHNLTRRGILTSSIGKHLVIRNLYSHFA